MGKFTLLGKIIKSNKIPYLFMIVILFYILISGYLLIFSGSVFIEGVLKGGYKASASDYDVTSLYIGFLFGFPSLCGVIGGLLVLSSRPERFLKFKVVLFVPWVVWSALQVVGNLRWGFEYWTQWLIWIPGLCLCVFILFGVVKKVRIPYFMDTRPEYISPNS